MKLEVERGFIIYEYKSKVLFKLQRFIPTAIAVLKLGD